MRNKLAHELELITFKQSDIIEILSMNAIKENSIDWVADYDLGKMDDIAIGIYSNIVYICKIINMLQTNS